MDAAVKNSFVAYVAQGRCFYTTREFCRAAESFTKALALQPNDRKCLVSRSKCYLRSDFPEKALEDAEAALVLSPHSLKSIYQKAEALYGVGDYEMALVFYHRGHRLRPDALEFRAGIQKCEKSIKKWIAVRVDEDDLRNYEQTIKLESAESDAESDSEKETKSEKTLVRRILYKPGMYGSTDHQFLEELLEDELICRGVLKCGGKVKDLIQDCLHYVYKQNDNIDKVFKGAKRSGSGLQPIPSGTPTDSYISRRAKSLRRLR